MTNCNYDLIHQLGIKMNSIWRYDQYIKDAQEECPDCVDLWKRLKEDDIKHIKLLREQIIEHVKAEKFE